MGNIRFVNIKGQTLEKFWATNDGATFANWLNEYLKSYNGEYQDLRDAIDQALGKTSTSGDKGKTFNSHPLVHGSAGKKEGQVWQEAVNGATVIAYIKSNDYYFIAVGRHKSSSTYGLDFHYQENSIDMKKDAIYDLTKSGDLK